MASSKSVAGPSAQIFRSICVFGGSKLGEDNAFRQAAYALGKTLAAKRIHVVYGDGLRGLKGCTIGTAISKGVQALGINFNDGGEQKCSNLSFCKTMIVSTPQERMAQMMYNSDAFIALPGGLETLEDILSVMSWANANFHQKPLGFFNVNGFFNGFLSFFEHTMLQGFTTQGLSNLFTHSSNPIELIENMERISLDLSNKRKNKTPKEDENRKRKRDEDQGDKKGKNIRIEPDTTLKL